MEITGKSTPFRRAGQRRQQPANAHRFSGRLAPRYETSLSGQPQGRKYEPPAASRIRFSVSFSNDLSFSEGRLPTDRRVPSMERLRKASAKSRSRRMAWLKSLQAEACFILCLPGPSGLRRMRMNRRIIRRKKAGGRQRFF
jgi:hypothetical protein